MAQNSKLGETCENCDRPSHTKPECWSKGGGISGQGLKQKRSKRGRKGKESATVVKEEEDELFAFTCTLDYTAKALKRNAEHVLTVAQATIIALTVINSKIIDPLQDVISLWPMAIS